MGPTLRVVDDLGAELEQVVHRPRDELLVARDRRRRHHDGVTLLHRDVAVVAERHPRERACRLALAARRDDAELVIGELANLVRADDRALGVLEVPELARRFRVVLHRTADDRRLSSPRRRDLHDLPDARDVRSEGRRDHATGRARHDRVEHLRHMSLGLCIARYLRAGRVRHQEEDAFRRDCGEAREVGLPAVDRRVIELPIARVHDGPVRSVDGHADRVGNAVADVVRVAAEIADAERSPRRDLAVCRALRELVLFQLRADEPDGQLGAVDRDVEEVA